MAVSSAGGQRRPFPLVPRRRLIGLPFGQVPSRRRGRGTEVIGLRSYERGDPIATIDWRASAQLSATSGSDEFVVRDHAADEAPRVVLVIDRRPAMALYPAPLPWLAKRAALSEAVTAIATSAIVAQADLGAVDFATGEPWWLPPSRRDRLWLLAERLGDGDVPFDAPEDTLERALDFLGRRRAQLPSGTFVFVLSDFLAPPSAEALRRADEHGWDVVPVVIQDPVWEQAFPAVGGVAVPVAEADGRSVSLVRVSGRQARARRDEHARRHAGLQQRFAAFGMRPVAIGTSDPTEIDTRFLEWSNERSQLQHAR